MPPTKIADRLFITPASDSLWVIAAKGGELSIPALGGIFMHGARQLTATATYSPADATSRGMGNTRDTQREASTRTAQPFVDQLRFARSEFGPCLVDGSDEDAVTCLLPMNSLGWIICHLAGQERHFWFTWAQGITDVAPELNEWGTFEKPAITLRWRGHGRHGRRGPKPSIRSSTPWSLSFRTGMPERTPMALGPGSPGWSTQPWRH
jgi:hypothetical protein